MKKLIFCAIFCCMSFALHAQSPTTFSQFYLSEFQNEMLNFDTSWRLPPSTMGPFPYGETEEGKEMAELYTQRSKFYPYGDFSLGLKADSLIALRRLSSSSCSNANWQPLGPSGDPAPGKPNTSESEANKNGRLDCIAMKYNDSNIVYVGSGKGGGLWKVNIATNSATNMNTDKISLHTGVGNVVALPSGRIIITTGQRYGNIYYGQWEFSCTGVYYSDDEGGHWDSVNILDKNGNVPFGYGKDNQQWASKIAVHPSHPDTMFMTFYNISVLYESNQKNFGSLYKSTDGGLNWNEVNNDSLTSRYFQDIEFNPLHPDTVYLSSHKLYRSTDGGANWHDVTGYLNGLPSMPSDRTLWPNYQILLTVPNTGCVLANTDHVVVLVQPGPDGLGKTFDANFLLYHSNDALSSSVSSIINTADKANPEMAVPFHLGLTMARNPDTIYVAGAIFQRSDDGGQFLTNRGYWNGDIHPDNQQIFVPPFTGHNAGTVFVCTDGGLYKSVDYGNSFTSYNNELMISAFYGLGVSQTDNRIIGASQDNYNIIHHNTGVWAGLGTGDGSKSCPINPNDPSQIAYADLQSHGTIIVQNFGSGTISTTDGGSFPPFQFAHYLPSTLLAATDRLYRAHGNTVIEGHTFKRSWGADSTLWAAYNTARVFDYCQSKPNIIYAATEGQWQDNTGKLAPDATVNYGDPNGFLNYCLYKSIDSGQNWTNITDVKTGNTGAISGIAVDPLDPDKVWICWSGYANGRTGAVQSVYKSTNGGATFYDYNEGLPLGSAKDIVYQRGSNDLLYLCTEKAVYYRDASMTEWECFDNNLPMTHFTDLEISYCTGKLYLSTFGRGIWATDLKDYVMPGASEIIDTYTVWNSSKFIHSGIEIKPGAELKIRSGTGDTTVIRMPKNGYIIVDSGAKLTIDTAKITNGCENCMWGGIKVIGRSNLGQNPGSATQGKLFMTGSFIENAVTAITNWDGTSYNTTGGLIQVKGTRFVNNARSVFLNQYTSPANVKYWGIFDLCNFEVNSNYKNDTTHPFTSHVELVGVDGPTFAGCTFKCEPGSFWGKANGIKALDAGVSVRRYTNGGFHLTNKFVGFKNGVYIGGIQPWNFASYINNSHFDSCTYGIRIVGSDYVTAIFDSFKVGNGQEGPVEPGQCHRNIGIFATGCEFGKIENNFFRGYNPSGFHSGDFQNIGVYVENSGGNDKQVYLNKFRAVNQACIGAKNNHAGAWPYSKNDAGLRFLCNDFDSCGKDIVVGGDWDSPNFHGIASFQGDTITSASNKFRSSTADHLTNYAYFFNYFYHPFSSNTNKEQPTNITLSTIFSTYSNLHVFSKPANERDCSPNFDINGSNTPKLNPNSNPKTKAYGANVLRIAAKNRLDNAVDNGNTDDLVAWLDGKTSSDATLVYSTMMSYSPFLSDVALHRLAFDDILSSSQLMDVLLANPEMLLNADLLNYLGTDAPTPLSSGDIGTLKAAAGPNSIRTSYEANLSEYSGQFQDAANTVVTDMLLDSAAAVPDSVIAWLNLMNTPEAEYTKAGYLEGIGDISGASSVLTDLPGKFAFTAEESEEHERYMNLRNIIHDIRDDGRTLLEATTGEIASILDIGDNAIPNGRLVSKIPVINEYPYHPPSFTVCEEPTEGKPDRNSKGKANGYQRNNKSMPNAVTNKNKIVTYPNPTRDMLIFEHRILDATGTVKIVITDVVGRKAKEITLETLTGQTKWDTHLVQPGVYIYKMTDARKTIATGRITVTK